MPFAIPRLKITQFFFRVKLVFAVFKAILGIKNFKKSKSCFNMIVEYAQILGVGINPFIASQRKKMTLN